MITDRSASLQLKPIQTSLQVQSILDGFHLVLLIQLIQHLPHKHLSYHMILEVLCKAGSYQITSFYSFKTNLSSLFPSVSHLSQLFSLVMYEKRIINFVVPHTKVRLPIKLDHVDFRKINILHIVDNHGCASNTTPCTSYWSFSGIISDVPNKKEYENYCIIDLCKTNDIFYLLI